MKVIWMGLFLLVMAGSVAHAGFARSSANDQASFADTQALLDSHRGVSDRSCYTAVRCPRGYNIWCEVQGPYCEADRGWNWVWCGAWDDWGGYWEDADYCRW